MGEFKFVQATKSNEYQRICDKDIQKREKLITIQISKYLSHALAENIAGAQWHSCSPEWINRIRRATYDDSYFYDCFDVVALERDDSVIGRLHCIQNEIDQNLWYYGDLFVIPEYRRMGIATRMIHAAIDYLMELGAKTLRVYVEPDNLPSTALQKSIGFEEKPYQGFNNLIHDKEHMFELDLPSPYSVIPAKTDEAVFVTQFYWQNIESLHGKPISMDEWKTVLSSNNEDERNFLVCRGCMPLAWLRINGLLNKDMAWIGMLAVSDKHHRQGIGRYAIEFSEQFVKEKGFRKIGVRITEDNIPAQNLYRKCGYAVTEYGECEAGDGIRRMGYTFVKAIENN